MVPCSPPTPALIQCTLSILAAAHLAAALVGTHPPPWFLAPLLLPVCVFVRQALFVVSVLTAKPVFVVSVLTAKPVFVVSVGLRVFQKI